MIDFIKINVKNPDISAIRGNQLLQWDQLADEGTGEVKEYTAQYRGVSFRITANKYMDISGSLHKYWNEMNQRGSQNYNDFRYPDLVEAVRSLTETFDLRPDYCLIQNIEFGVNITPPIPVNEILKAAINHRLKPFTTEYGATKRFRECEHQRYIIKLYNKGLQFDQPGQILRFELKVLKMIELEKYGIGSVADILDIEKLDRLGRELTDNFREILFFGIDIQLDQLSNRDRITLSEGRAPQYWEELKKRDKNIYGKRRERFIELVKRHTTFDISENISDLIMKKWIDLSRSEQKTLHQLTGVQKKKTLHQLTGGSTLINPSGKGLLNVNFEKQATDEKGDILERLKNDPTGVVWSGRRWSLKHYVPVLSPEREVISFMDLSTGFRVEAECKLKRA